MQVSMPCRKVSVLDKIGGLSDVSDELLYISPAA